jgi:hypothetical protein
MLLQRSDRCIVAAFQYLDDIITTKRTCQKDVHMVMAGYSSNA